MNNSQRDVAYRNSHDQHEQGGNSALSITGSAPTPAQPITPVGSAFTQAITAEALEKSLPYLTGGAEEAARRQLDAYKSGRK